MNTYWKMGIALVGGLPLLWWGTVGDGLFLKRAAASGPGGYEVPSNAPAAPQPEAGPPPDIANAGRSATGQAVVLVPMQIPAPAEPPTARAFIEDARDGSSSTIRRHLNSGIAIDSTDDRGRTALLRAVSGANLPAVRELLAAGASPALADEDGRTPLIIAAIAGNIGILRALIEAGAAIDAPDATGRPALHHAILSRQVAAVDYLLWHKADAMGRSGDGKDALACAFESQDAALVKTLLALQPRDLRWSDHTRKAFADALAQRDRDLLRFLIEKHPAPPMHAGVRQPLVAQLVAVADLDKLRLLLECGADPNPVLTVPAHADFLRLMPGKSLPHYLQSEPGITPLMVAAGMGRTETVELLLKHGARRGALTGKYKLAALNFAAWGKNVDAMQILLGKKPAPSFAQDRVVISLALQRAEFFKAGKVVLTSEVSTGRSDYPTPKGQFVVTDKQRLRTSTIYHLPMPYFLRLSCSEVGMHAGVVPGYPASHGCIRLPKSSAIKLYKAVELGTLVVIQ